MDMGALSKEICLRITPDFDKRQLLIGKTKIYMKLDRNNHLDRLLQEWYKYKNEMASKITLWIK